MTKKLNVEFNLDNGKKYTFGLAEPKDDITKTEVQAFADEVINNKVFIVSGAYPASVGSMYIHTEEDTELE